MSHIVRTLTQMMTVEIYPMGNSWKYRLSNKEKEELLRLSEKLYWQEHRKSGMTTSIPYAWIADNEEKFIAVSIFGVHSETMRNKLKEII